MLMKDFYSKMRKFFKTPKGLIIFLAIFLSIKLFFIFLSQENKET